MHRCRITIRGGLDDAGREAVGDFDIEPSGADTVLIGELDQSGIRPRWRGITSLEAWRWGIGRATVPERFGRRPLCGLTTT